MEKYVFVSLKLFFWILIGSILKFISIKFPISTSGKNINTFLHYITNVIVSLVVPYYICTLIWETGIQQNIGLVILFLFLTILSVEFFISKKVAFFTGYKFNEIFFSLAFMNTLYLGIPVTEYLVSKNAVYYTIIYSIIVTVLQFTLGLYLLSPGKILPRLFLPIILFFLLGLGLNIAKIPPEPIFIEIKNILSIILPPLMLILIGFSLPLKNILKNIKIHILVVFLCRIIAGLAVSFIFWSVSKFFFPKIDLEFVKTTILVSILPSAIINYIVLEKLNIDTEFVTGEILIGTGLFLFLLPYISELIDVFILLIY